MGAEKKTKAIETRLSGLWTRTPIILTFDDFNVEEDGDGYRYEVTVSAVIQKHRPVMTRIGYVLDQPEPSNWVHFSLTVRFFFLDIWAEIEEERRKKTLTGQAYKRSVRMIWCEKAFIFK